MIIKTNIVLYLVESLYVLCFIEMNINVVLDPGTANKLTLQYKPV